MILSNQSFSWLDLTPNQWEIDRVKDHFYFSDIQTENFDNYPVLSLTMTGVKKRNMDTNKGQLPESYEKYNLVDSSCLVFNPMDLISGWVDVPKTEGLISPSYRTIKLRSDKTNLHFIKYYFQSLYKEKVLFYFGEGVHYEYRWGLGKETLKNFPIPIPPKEEQNQIVLYLDNKVHQIDELKIKIQQKIELLREQRTSVINEVVTKGLNPNVEMKESGVEWIGEIPSHWNIIRGKYILKILSGVYPSEIIEDKDGEHFVKVDDLNYVENSYYLSSSKLKIRDFGKNTLEGGIILFPKRGMTIFTNKVVITKSRCFIDPNLMGIKVFDSFNKIFLFYLLKNRGLGDICDSSTIPQINNKHIYPLKFVNPPINEQEQIVLYLDKKLKLIDESISKEEKRIKLLKEYKQSLISEVVTGKKRVV